MTTTNLYVLSATTVNTTQTYTTIPNLQFTMTTSTPAQQYHISAYGTMMVSGTTSGGTAGINFRLNIPTDSEANIHTFMCNASTTSLKSNVLKSNGDATGLVCTNNATELGWRLNGIVDSGTSGGTFSISFKNAGGGQTAYINKYSSLVVISY